MYTELSYVGLINFRTRPGLYSPTDKILILTSSTIRDAIFERPTASLVEFYNSYCGACQRFVPTWKAVAQNISLWSSVVQIGALDCASDENNDICRQYEVMRYPTMRYFPPNYLFGDKQLGTNLDHLLVPKVEDVVDELTHHLVNETRGDKDWPKFEKFSGNSWKDLYDDAALGTKFVYVLNDELPGLLSQQVVLDNVNIEQTSVRIVESHFKLLKVSTEQRLILNMTSKLCICIEGSII